jgi:HD-GYP domain-containing protein (c-di-GMP phosphodiesterase class II)
VFAGLLEMRNGLLGGHGKRVADLARRIAVAMEVPSDQVQDIFVAGLLHDIGFMAVPDALLAKPVGRYTADEMQLYQRHAVLGAQSLMALDDLQAVASLIRSHHERFDGKGYPDKIAGSAIPGQPHPGRGRHLGRLAAGHLTGAQLAGRGQTLMQRARGIQFDPEVVDVILQLTQAETPRAVKLQAIGTDGAGPGMVLGKDSRPRKAWCLLAAGRSSPRPDRPHPAL